MMQWHLKNINTVFEITGSAPGGLSATEAGKRLQQYGPNIIEQVKNRSPWKIFLLQFKDFIIIILIGTAIISGVLSDIADTIIIMAIVILNAIVGFIQEYRAEKAMEALKKMSVISTLVIRNNSITSIDSTLLVPGDVILLEPGNIVPADVRLFEAVLLKVNESSLTGESIPVEKQIKALPAGQIPLGEYTNMAFKGTHVTYGRGKGIVTATGMHTELGKIALLLQQPGTQTPLQKRLTVFSKNLAYIILFICVIVFAIGYLQGENIVLMLMTALSLAVAAIPEALPAVITIALAIGAKKMIRKSVLIRKLPAVETLGSVTYICTDKTGTLTINKMTVEDVFGKDFRLGSDTGNNIMPDSKEYQLLLQAMALNNDVHTDKDDRMVGDPTETALYEYALAKGFIKKEFEKQLPRVAEIPFDAERKCMTTIHRYENRYIIFVKGAVEMLVPKLKDGSGVIWWKDPLHKMMANGLRVLAFGTKELDVLPGEITAATIENGLRLIGIAGIIDPPREQARQAVKECKSAGIKPVMITGDHPITAATIARRLNIIESKEDRIVSAIELNKMNDRELAEIVDHIKVYARVSPEQKLRIVKALQQKGEYVAMTGDGVNDAPALKHADIGIAMGITGTDVSKEAAHMILLDDNFSTIVNAVKEGRRIFDNIRKFIRYVLTGNSAEILTIFLAPFFGLPIPLLPIQILWVNLVTDGLPGLALALEPAEKNIMKRRPRHPGQSIFADGLGIHVLWVGLLLASVTMGIQAYAIYNHHPWQTMVFTVLCLGQLMHVMAIRSENVSLFHQGLFSNKALIISVLLTFLLQIALIYIPLLNTVFKTQPLTAKEFLLCIAVSLIIFVAVEIEKFIRRSRKSSLR